MPFYNYKCEDCESITEELRTYSSREASTECSCGGVSVKTVATPKLYFDGSDPDFISYHKKWVERHETQGNGVRSRC